MDFLSAHSALIDCATGQIELALPDTREPPDASSPRLCSASTTRLAPSSTIYIDVLLTSPVADGKYLVSPNPDLLFECQLVISHCAVLVANGVACLPVVNTSGAPQTISMGMSLALASLLHEYFVSSLENGENICPATVQSSILDTPALEAMTDASLTTSEQRQLIGLLAQLLRCI